MHSYLDENMTLNYSLPEIFVGLLNELWEVSFRPSHIKGGFHGSGLYPLSRAAIHPSKLATAAAFHQQPSEQQSQKAAQPETQGTVGPQSQGSQSQGAVGPQSQGQVGPHSQQLVGPQSRGTVGPQLQQTCVGSRGTASTTVELSCTKCGRSMTPVRLHVVAYFSRHLEWKKQAPKNSKRIKPTFFGEAFTKDEVFARIEEAERAKEKEKEEKEQRQATRRKKQKKKMKQVEVNEEDSDNEAQANDTEDGG